MPNVTVHGWCDLSTANITRAIREGREDELVEEAGDFVVVAEERATTRIVASSSGIVNYFLSATDSRDIQASHGPDIATIMQVSGLDAKWNYTALADYLTFGHTLGDDTLNPAVRRVPPGSIVTLDEHGTRIKKVASSRRYDNGQLGPDSAVEALLSAVQRATPPSSSFWLSMSGGFDTRLLMAALLAMGRRPSLIVSGTPHSFDREVSTLIARHFDLRLVVIEVTASEVAEGAGAVAQRTNGLLPVTHWAGLEHLRTGPRGICLDGPVLFGTNGEFARSYYAPPIGFAAACLAHLPLRTAVAILQRRFRSPFRPEEKAWLHPALHAALEPSALQQRLFAAMRETRAQGALDVLDEFFAAEYGRHKTSADLAALDMFVDWRVPLFGGSWLHAVQALPRSWKLGSRWHRYAIDRLCPELLRFPEEGYDRRTSRRPPLRYWHSGPRVAHMRPFLDQAMFRSPMLIDLLLQRRELIEDLVAPDFVMKLAQEQIDRGVRPHLFFALAAIALWREGL